MEYGSIFGHGAWLGPDYTADYLHRAAEMAIAYYGGNASGAARQQTIADFKTNRYDRGDGRVDLQRGAGRRLSKTHRLLRRLFRNAHHKISVCVPMRLPTRNKSGSSRPFSVGRPGRGRPCARTKIIPTRTTGRPNRSSANHASADTMLWSVLSLIALLGGIGLLLAAFGRWNFLGWHGREEQQHFVPTAG